MEESRRSYRKGEEYVESPPKPVDDMVWRKVMGADGVEYESHNFADQYIKWWSENYRTCPCGKTAAKEGVCSSCLDQI